MSVLIKGMDMPKNCFDCPCHNGEWGDCDADSKKPHRSIYGDIPSWCPLVEVPTPHGALIDRDKWADEMREKLLPELAKKYGETDALKGLHFSFLDCIENVNNADVIIAAGMIHDGGRS